MPQIDLPAVMPVFFWTSILYVGGYLFLNATALFAFFAQLKLRAKRTVAVYRVIQLRRRLVGTLTFFPWIAL